MSFNVELNNIIMDIIINYNTMVNSYIVGISDRDFDYVQDLVANNMDMVVDFIMGIIVDIIIIIKIEEDSTHIN